MGLAECVSGLLGIKMNQCPKVRACGAARGREGAPAPAAAAAREGQVLHGTATQPAAGETKRRSALALALRMPPPRAIEACCCHLEPRGSSFAARRLAVEVARGNTPANAPASCGEARTL